MKQVAILYNEYTPVIDAIKYQLSGCTVECIKELKDSEKYDLVIVLNYEGEYKENALCCHYSLLPAFQGEEPVKQAMLEGVKVTGLTFYYTKPYKIVAQYPMFITNGMHYEDVKQALAYLEQVLFPLVADRIINNIPFDTQELINKGCNGNCGGCSGCNH